MTDSRMLFYRFLSLINAEWARSGYMTKVKLARLSVAYANTMELKHTGIIDFLRAKEASCLDLSMV